jgi:acylphosphatase
MEAKRLGLKGWVKNCSDGSVELIAEGDLAMLEELEQWCRQGPPGAVVRRVERRWEDLTDEFDDFLIKR